MTREEAIAKVKGYLTDLLPSEEYDEVEEIIKALEQEPREITLEDVKEYCKPRCLTIITDELLYELTHPKIKALKQEPKSNGRTIDADELLKRIAEKCKIPSLSKDTVNGLCGATAIIYDMLIESGQEKDADKESD